MPDRMTTSIPKSECVRFVNQRKLPNVLHSISNYQVTMNKIPVTVFRSVLENVEIDAIDISAYLESNDFVVYKETFQLENVDPKVLLTSSDCSKSLINRKSLLSNELTKYVERQVNETDDEFSARVIKKMFDEAEYSETYYARDLSIAPDSISRLVTPSSTIHPHYGAPEVEGVNSPMWYVGGPGSTTSFHVEDGGFASMNVLLKGEEKIWRFIVPSQYPLLKLKIKEELNMKECRMFHKPGLSIYPELLKKWGIDVFYVVQRAGNLVYVGESVLHFVVNNGLNIAEAMNFGTKSCTVKSEITACECSDEDLGRTRREYYVAVSLPEQKAVDSTALIHCDWEDCKKFFLYVENYRKHILESHNEFSYVCKITDCNKCFRTKQALHKHVKAIHLKQSKKVICPFENCNKMILQKNLSRHVKGHGNSRVKGTCNNCNREMLKKNLPKHFEKCKGELRCQTCMKVLKTLQGSLRHKC